jgi:hypothetical protein
MSRWRSRRSVGKVQPGTPKFKVDDVVGDFTILYYLGHSAVNKRTGKSMAKAQHWYHCVCECGQYERRSQQELIDTRRQKRCYECRPKYEESTC